MQKRLTCIELDAPDIETDFGYQLYEIWDYPRDVRRPLDVSSIKYYEGLEEYLQGLSVDLSGVDCILFQY